MATQENIETGQNQTAAAPKQWSLGRVSARLAELAEAHRPVLPARTKFQFRGIDFAVDVDHDAAERIQLRLTGCLGHLPFTAENEWNRRNIMEMVTAAARNIPARLRVDKGNALWLVQETYLEAHPDAHDVMTVLTQMVLHLMPMLELLKGRTIPLQG